MSLDPPGAACGAGGRVARRFKPLFTPEQPLGQFQPTIERMRRIITVATFLLVVVLAVRASAADMDPVLRDAHEMFYNGRYADAVAATATLCTPNVAALTACELRTSALHFQLRRVMRDSSKRQQVFAQCIECADILATFVAETRRGQETARTRLKAKPEDEDTLFLLGKLDLNYVWLQLVTLGRRTGWSEYWEARRSLDKVLKQNPRNVRAKVARAWIDYAVDTNVTGVARWLLGGGNRKRGLQAVREAAIADAARFVRAEAGFALWDMQVRERDIAGARATALTLSDDFPGNLDLRTFLDAHADGASKRAGR